MQLVEIKINGNNVDFLDQPDGLQSTNIKFDRDSFNGITIDIDTKLRFFCGSGKEQIDEEYENRYIDGIGQITLQEICNGQNITATFLLDFKLYKSNTDFTEVGLIEKNLTNNFKDNLKNPIEIQNEEDIYIRNLPLKYDFYSSKSTAFLKKSGDNPNSLELNQSRLFFIPEFERNQSELEDINILDDGYVFDSNYHSNGIPNNRILFIDNSGNVTNTPQNWIPISEIEPSIPLFENVTKDGFISLKTDKKRFINISAVCPNTPMEMSLWSLFEIIHIGRDFNNPRNYFRASLENYQGNPNFAHRFEQGTSPNFSLEPPPYLYGDYLLDYSDMYFNKYGEKLEVKKGESVWVFYIINFHTQSANYPNIPHNFVVEYDTLNISIDRSVSIEFEHSAGVQNTITNTSNIESTHTQRVAYKGKEIAETLFNGLSSSLFDDPCYSDLFFTDGIRLRNKTNRNNLKLTPESFFDELEKITACGLGVFYNSNVGSLQLQPIEKFYTDTISKVITVDLIDDVSIEPAFNMYYNKIEIGYNESKDTEKDIHRKNEYNIINKGASLYSKVTNYIASKYIISRALILNNGDQTEEYDNSIFLLSATNVNGKNITLSQTSGFVNDGVFETPTETNGMNRKYASIYNLFRHFRKWGFGLWKSYTTLENNSIYNKILQWNNQCGLPNTQIEAHKTIISTDYETKTMIPEYITFQHVMGIVEFWQMRNIWYDIIQVNMPNKTYYGNIVTAEYKDGIVNFKLIKRQI